jgi:hypothetical protein
MWKLGLRPAQFMEKEYINGIFVAVWLTIYDVVQADGRKMLWSLLLSQPTEGSGRE